MPLTFIISPAFVAMSLAAISATFAIDATAQADTSGSATISLADNPAYVSGFIGISAGVSVIVDANTSCTSGKVMLGLAGTRLKFVQKITPLCGTLNKDGSVSSIAPLDPGAIAANATGFSLKCGPGKVLTGRWLADQGTGRMHAPVATRPWNQDQNDVRR